MFERFVEVAQSVVGRPYTLFFVFVLTAAWAASFPLFHQAAEWHAVLHTTLAILSLVLLVLLENAGRRDAQASQEKLNLLTEALVISLRAQAARHDDAQQRRDLREMADHLRAGVGLEDRH